MLRWRNRRRPRLLLFLRLLPRPRLGAASGSFNGTPGGYVCNNGTAAANATSCSGAGGLWMPDLRTREMVFGAGVLVKF